MKQGFWAQTRLAVLVSLATLLAAGIAPSHAEEARGTVQCNKDKVTIPGFTSAEPAVRPKPRYPTRALNEWSEAWVRAIFTVTADGKVKDLVAVDALGSKAFVDETLRALNTWTYKPAQRNGTPVEQYGYETIFEFIMADGPERGAVHRQFITRYNQSRAFIREKKYAEAIEMLEAALKLRTNRYEAAMASFALTVAHAQLKNWRAALLHIRHATIFDSKLLEPATQAPALALRVQLEADDGNYKAAVCAYKDLLGVQPAGDAIAAKIIAQVDAALMNPAPLALKGRLENIPVIEGPATWMHPLLRAKFHFQQLQGEVKSFRLVCTGTILETAVDPEMEWTVPTTAGDCVLRVEGAPGATFLLIENW